MSKLRTADTQSQSPARNWFHRIAASLCLCSILLASGFHTVALQGYGWAKMYDVYSESLPAFQAVDITFSGEDLCGICVISRDLVESTEKSIELALTEKDPLPPLNVLAISVSEPLSTLARHFLASSRETKEFSPPLEPPPPRVA